jgi:hypothetical protein
MVGRATLCWCTAEFHIPPLWSLAASLGVMWSTCLPPTDPLSSPGPCRTGSFHLRIARLQRSLCSRATPKAWLVLVRPVHRLWRWRVTPNPYLARPACYLRCSGMNRRCRCRKTVVGVSVLFPIAPSPPFLSASFPSLVLHTKTIYKFRSYDPSPRSLFGVDKPRDRQEQAISDWNATSPRNPPCSLLHPWFACSHFIDRYLVALANVSSQDHESSSRRRIGREFEKGNPGARLTCSSSATPSLQSNPMTNDNIPFASEGAVPMRVC